jgi:hypothetical protein
MIPRMLRISALCLLLTCAHAAAAQNVSFVNGQLPFGDVLDKTLAGNVLTHDGVPFHAVLTFKPRDPDTDQNLNGKVEVFWAAPDRYRLQLDTPAFGQTLIVHGDSVQETDRGDFYPNWLRNFVTALLDPMPRLGQIRERPNQISGGQLPAGYFTQPCIGRNDRPGGITDDLTWARICFDKNRPQLQFAQDISYNMEFSNFADFHGKQIARTYKTEVRSDNSIIGQLVTLEDWQPDDAVDVVSKPTPAQDRILTTLVSTAQEESMLESAPKDVHWPTVREGRLDGYMIIYAITDRTGQVRETSTHNSDNPELGDFGRELALKYKFKPLLVNGVAQQMEMPLVLHFTATNGDPIPELDDAQTRRLITGCDLPHDMADPASAGHQIEIIFSVQDDGHLDTLGSSDRKVSVLGLFRQFGSCHFAVYSQNGKPTPYYAHLSVKAK